MVAKIATTKPVVAGCLLEARCYAAKYKGDRYQMGMLPNHTADQMMERLVAEADLDPNLVLSYGLQCVEECGQFTTNGQFEFYVDPVYATVYHHGNQETTWGTEGPDNESVNLWVPTIQITQPPPAINWSPADPSESHKVYHRKIRKVFCCRWCWGPRHDEGFRCVYEHYCRMCLVPVAELAKHSCATCHYHVEPTQQEPEVGQKRAYDPGMAPGEAQVESPASKRRMERQLEKIARMATDSMGGFDGNPNKQRKNFGGDSPSRRNEDEDEDPEEVTCIGTVVIVLLTCMQHIDLCGCSELAVWKTHPEPFQLKPNAHSVYLNRGCMDPCLKYPSLRWPLSGPAPTMLASVTVQGSPLATQQHAR